VLLFDEVSNRLMGFLMGFAAGVMLIVAFLNLFSEAMNLLTPLEATVAFTAGTILMMAVDLTLPHIEAGEWEGGYINPGLFKSGTVIAIGMSLHNFPEGIVVSAGYSHMPRLGLYIALMICLHNIPEGIATAGPLSMAGTEKRKALLMTFASGMTEPLGALLGSTILASFGGGEKIIGIGMGLAAGVMTYITVDELIPVAHEYFVETEKHMVSIGLLMGLIFAQVISVVLGV